MPQRQGYTLLELMLVLAIIVVAASLSFPVVDRLLNRNKASAALDTVWTLAVRARNLAMAEGRSYTIKVKENSGCWRLEPDEESELTAESDQKPTRQDGELPEGVVFVKQYSALLAGSFAPVPGDKYETAFTFLPDGSAAQDVVLIFGVWQEAARGLGVRSLTGAIYQVDLTGAAP
jgi:prepilin-type N-terminal cleavage/methylation domain-containing protein